MDRMLEEKSLSVIDQAEALKVANQEGYEVAAAQVGALTALEKQIKEFYGPKKKAAKVPYDALVAEEKGLLEKPGKAKGILKGKMSAYFKRQEEDRKAEEKRLHELAQEEGLSEEEARHLVVTSSMEQPSGTTQRKVWKWRQIGDVPIDYMILDEKRITAEVKSRKGDTKIPGIQAYVDFTTVVQS